MKFQLIHDKIHELEALLAAEMNKANNHRVKQALEKAHDNLCHQVTEWIRTAEKHEPK
jgi:hypothetical protein